MKMADEIGFDAVAERLDQVRMKRNALLDASDWTQMTDSPLSEAKKVEWATYRQHLRDITDAVDIFSIEWPEAPE